MTELPLTDRTIGEVATALRAGETSSRELTEACLERIGLDAERLNTFLAVDADAARRAADVADGALASGEGEDRPLLGVPYALKDIFVTRALDAVRNAAGRGPADHGRQPHPRGLSLAVPLGGPGGARARGRGAARQDELRRVRHGLVERELGLRPRAQSLGRDDRPGRQLRRVVGGGRGRPGVLRARYRYGRQHPPAGLADRHGRHEADVRAREPVRHGRVRLQPRPGRSVRAVGARRCARAPGDRRPRPARRDQRRHPGARLRGGAERRGPRPSPGRPARVLRGGHGARCGGRGPHRHRHAARPGRRDRRRQPAVHRPGPGDVLHHRSGRGIARTWRATTA